MNEEQRFLILSQRKLLSRDLLVGDTFSFLQSKFVLDIEEVELIKNERTSRERAEKLIDTIVNKKRNFFKQFYDSLIYAEYSHLADLLKNGLPEDINETSSEEEEDSDSDYGELPDIETILKNAGVPQLPYVYVERQECIKSLQDALWNLKDDDGWVIVHGMAGSGKSLLAASSLDNEELVHKSFPGGIFWLNIGKIGDAKLLIKMQNLCSRLDNGVRNAPNNLEESRDRLRHLFANEHPRCLLVLDDVWSPKTAKYFDIRVRILVTTRNPGIFSKINSQNLHMVKIKESFELNKSLEVFSKWTNIPINELPPQAVSIANRCMGSPLAISMIGALLKGRSNRWDYYLTQLNEQKTSKLKSKLSYEYPSLYDALDVSLESLTSDVKERFEMLAIFDSDVNIPTSVLAIYWEYDDIEVEDAMDELIERSLVYYNSDGRYYYLHGILLDFLKETLTKDGKITKYHQQLADSYYNTHQQSFLAIPNDFYIHWNLISHLLQAQQTSTAVSLLRNFNWLQTCVRYTNPVVVILALKNVITKAAEVEDLKIFIPELEDLENFISIHLHRLTSHSAAVDLVQLALLQPTSERILQLAEEEAVKILRTHVEDCPRIFYHWVNQPKNLREDVLLSTRVHDGPVNSCCFSNQPPNNKVVSCGDDKLVKIWDSTTGEILTVLDGHSDIVNHAEFTFDDQKIISCSSDKTIKVWSVVIGKEVLSMLGHKDDVLCCRCSKDGSMVASASIDSTVKLWSLESGFLIATFSDHEDVVNWCCFSSDDRLLASCSNDMYIKIYDVAKRKLLTTGGGDADFISFCVFTPDDKGVVYTSLNMIKIYSLDEERTIQTITYPCDVITVDYSPDHAFLATSHVDMTARLYDIVNEVCVRQFTGHTSWLTSVNFCKENSNILTSSEDGICTIFESNQICNKIEKLQEFFDVDFSEPMEPLIVTCTTKNQIQVQKNTELLLESERFGSRVTCCCVTVGFVCVGCECGKEMILGSNDLKIVHTFTNHRTSVTLMQCGRQHKHWLLSCSELEMMVTDLTTGKLISKCIGHEGSITKCQFYKSESRIVSTSFDGTSKIWDAEKGVVLYSLKHDGDLSAVMSCAVSPDEKYLLGCSAASECKIYSSEDGNPISTIKDPGDDVIRCVTFSDDGEYFATGSDNGSAKVWKIEDRKMICECKGHRFWVQELRFNHSRTQLLSISENIRIFDITGRLMQTINLVGGYLKSVCCSNDFSVCVTVDNLGYLYILKSFVS